MSTIEEADILTDPSIRPMPVTVGLLGCGVVGSAVARRLLKDPNLSEEALGVRVEIKRVAILHEDKMRDVPLDSERFTTDPTLIVNDPEIDVVVEAIGGTHPAFTLVSDALRNGKHVITANKELIANHGDQLRELAGQHGSHLRYEAAVGGAIPVLRAIREGLRGTRIRRLSAVLNGTCNLVLTRMEAGGVGLATALEEAVRSGYAETDSSSDVGGWDATFKLTILVHEAFSLVVEPQAVSRRGIEALSVADLHAAKLAGYRIRQVATAEWDGVILRAEVQPAALAEVHPLARLQDCENGVILQTDEAGSLYLQGQGAGGDPTATSIIGDLGSVARAPACAVGRLTRRPSAIKAHDLSRFLFRVVFDAGGDAPIIAGAFFGHGLGIDASIPNGPHGSVVISEACTPHEAELVKECLVSRGASHVSVFPIL